MTDPSRIGNQAYQALPNVPDFIVRVQEANVVLDCLAGVIGGSGQKKKVISTLS